MTLTYAGPKRRMDDQTKHYSFDEVRELVRTLSVPDTTLITTLPCGTGLDFHAEADDRVWLEFYADGLHAATVSPDVAEKVFERAFYLSALLDPKATFADLISTWDY